jgi:hypothetical protein
MIVAEATRAPASVLAKASRHLPLVIVVLASLAVSACSNIAIGPVPERTCPPDCHAQR